MKLGYWGFRGRAQGARLMLAYTGQEFEDVKYVEKEKWFDEDKKNLGIEFPNLPYLIDGDFNVTQSKAIVAYIVTKSGKIDLFGKDLQDRARVVQLSGVFEDGIGDLLGLFFNPKYEEAKEAPIKKLQGKFDQLGQWIGEKDWVMGYLTVCDFAIAQTSYYIEKISPDTYNKYPFLKRIRDNFQNLPEIKAYYQKQTAVKGPFIPPFAALPF